MIKTPTGQADLPDLNVWLALADKDHAHHARARRYWELESAAQVAFCRISMLGLLRLGTNAKAMGGQPFTPVEAWRAYRAFRALPEVTFLDEPARLEAQMAAWSDTANFAAQAWTDCCLASVAILSNCRLVSFDRQFSRFTGLQFLRLEL
jgi:toxin-antitoxin system PIN domain toxin